MILLALVLATLLWMSVVFTAVGLVTGNAISMAAGLAWLMAFCAIFAVVSRKE